MSDQGTPAIGLVVALFAVAMAGCGDDAGSGGAGGAGAGTGGAGAAPSPLPFGSGSRLRAEVLDGGGGALQFSGFVDTELGVRCWLLETSGGVQRCAPYSLLTVLFADPDCAEPVLLDEPCSGGQFGAIFELDGCVGSYRMVRRTDEAAPGPLYERLDGGCVPSAIDPAVAFVAEEVPDETFLAATERIEPLGGGLAREVWDFEDGAYLARRAVDEERDGACRPPAAAREGGALPCVPEASAVRYDGQGRFGDAACTAPLAVRWADCGDVPPPVVVEDWVTTSCAPEVVYREPGDVVETAFGGEASVCEQLPARPEELWLAPGALVDLAIFPSLERVRTGGGRLVTEGVGVRAAWVDAGAAWLDSELGEPCQPTRFADGSTRCLPASNALYTLFSDEACTRPVVEHTGCDEVPGLVLEWEDAADNCAPPAVGSVRALGAPYGGPVFYAADPGSCLSWQVEGQVHELGEEVPFDAFATVTERQE